MFTPIIEGMQAANTRVAYTPTLKKSKQPTYNIKELPLSTHTSTPTNSPTKAQTQVKITIGSPTTTNTPTPVTNLDDYIGLEIREYSTYPPEVQLMKTWLISTPGEYPVYGLSAVIKEDILIFWLEKRHTIIDYVTAPLLLDNQVIGEICEIEGAITKLVFAIEDKTWVEGMYSTRVYQTWQIDLVNETIEEIPIDNVKCWVDVGEGYP
jgi:hypothetical protein